VTCCPFNCKFCASIWLMLYLCPCQMKRCSRGCNGQRRQAARCMRSECSGRRQERGKAGLM
jgi:hypothetical protein